MNNLPEGNYRVLIGSSQRKPAIKGFVPEGSSGNLFRFKSKLVYHRNFALDIMDALSEHRDVDVINLELQETRTMSKMRFALSLFPIDREFQKKLGIYDSPFINDDRNLAGIIKKAHRAGYTEMDSSIVYSEGDMSRPVYNVRAAMKQDGNGKHYK